MTGGARGIGAAHVVALLKAGAKVMCTDVLVDEGETFVNGLASDRVLFHRLDIMDEGAWKTTIATAEQHFGAVSALVNNAGVFETSLIEEMPLADFRRVLEINTIGTFLGMQSVLPSMRKAGGGSIVNISSIAGIAGSPRQVAYVASKFAVRGMTKVAALEFAQDNIRVNSIHPGAIATPMTTNVPAPASIPIPRFAQPAEVANMMLFLVSDASSYCTGSEFTVDGGYLCKVGTNAGTVRQAKDDALAT